MTIRHLNIFLAVCAEGCNTTRAAQALHMTQPAVSLAIRELEQYYGVVLFDRLGRRLVLTEAGHQMEDRAAHISALFRELERVLRDWDSLGLLRVGASMTIGSRFLPWYVKAFLARYPGTQVRTRVAPSEELERALLDSSLDLALIEGPTHSPSLLSEAYMEDELAVIRAPGGPGGGHMSLEEFRRQRFLLREPGSGTREVFDRAIESAGFTVEPEWEASSTTALVNAAIAGLGIAVLPLKMVSGLIGRGIVEQVEVEDLELSRKFNIVYHREKYLTAAARSFIDLCRNYELDYPLPAAVIL